MHFEFFYGSRNRNNFDCFIFKNKQNFFGLPDDNTFYSRVVRVFYGYF